MNSSSDNIQTLHSIRNLHGGKYISQKLKLLEELLPDKVNRREDFISYSESLNFLIAYPDNNEVYEAAIKCSFDLAADVGDKKHKLRLYNTGITNTKLSASF